MLFRSPFSHAWEHVFPGHSHEAWGARIVAEDAEQMYGRGNPELVSEVTQPAAFARIGADKARAVASRTLERTYRSIGLLPL